MYYLRKVGASRVGLYRHARQYAARNSVDQTLWSTDQWVVLLLSSAYTSVALCSYMYKYLLSLLHKYQVSRFLE